MQARATTIPRWRSDQRTMAVSMVRLVLLLDMAAEFFRKQRLRARRYQLRGGSKRFAGHKIAAANGVPSRYLAAGERAGGGLLVRPGFALPPDDGVFRNHGSGQRAPYRNQNR